MRYFPVQRHGDSSHVISPYDAEIAFTLANKTLRREATWLPPNAVIISWCFNLTYTQYIHQRLTLFKSAMQRPLPRNLVFKVRFRSASTPISNNLHSTATSDGYVDVLDEGFPCDNTKSTGNHSRRVSLPTSCFDNDSSAESEWVGQIDGLIIDEDSEGSHRDKSRKYVGHCNGKLIRRDQIRAQFRSAMGQLSEEACLLAFSLMDRFGRLKADFKNHPVKKGTGLWSSGLESGDIFLIESLQVEKPCQLFDQGIVLVKTVLEKVRRQTPGFVAIVRPSGAPCDPSKKEVFRLSPKMYSLDSLECFWRELGFRRIGSSAWFGLSLDPKHPCHRLDAAHDFIVPKVPPMTSGISDDEILPRMKAALKCSSDDDSLKILKQLTHDEARDGPHLGSIDTANGDTILHLVAVGTRPNCVRFILDRKKSLLHMRNFHGETPLDALVTKLEEKRTTHRHDAMVKDISDNFAGFSDPDVDCLILLDGSTDLSEANIQRLRYGCSCGQCIYGCLSPRMRVALELVAGIWSEFLCEFIDDGDLWVRQNRVCFTFLSDDVQMHLKNDKCMRNGFRNLCVHFINCLRGNMIPNDHNVQLVLNHAGESPPDSWCFLQRGGSVDAVASMLFQFAMESDELAGDATHSEDQFQLPRCRNDHEFGFVSGLCGYERISPRKSQSARF